MSAGLRPTCQFVSVASAVLLATVSCSRGDRPRSAEPSTTTISIVGTNDLHGAIFSEDERGGLALLDGYIRNLRLTRAVDGGAVILLDAGDLFQGSLESNSTEGAVVVSAYNAMGYTATAIGNHDFDFGPSGTLPTPASAGDDPRGALKARAMQARFPFLAANLIDESTGRTVQWPNIAASTIVAAAGFRIGIVGLMTAEALTTTIRANTQGLAIAPLAPTLQAEAARLRQAGATIVVATVHAGGMCDAFGNPADLNSCSMDEEVFVLARALPPGVVDAIVAGHRHQGIAHVVGGIPVISSYWRGRAFGRIDLLVDRASGHPRGHRLFPPHEVCAREDVRTGECVDTPGGQERPAEYEGRPVVASSDIAALLEPAAELVRPLKEATLNAVIEGSLALSSRDESPLGNLVADWMRAVVPTADVAIVNGGNLRAALPAGPLTYGRLYEVMPFDNREVIVDMSGAEFRRVIENNLKQRDSALIVSGVRVAASCDRGHMRIDVRRDSGKPVSDAERLTVVTSDFLASGGDDFFAPIEPLRIVRDDGPLVREHIAEWLKTSSRRWRGGSVTSTTRRIAYPGARPVMCGPS